MDGVKTAIIGFIFVCIIFPHIIKNRHQYYLGLTAVLLSMLFQMVALLLNQQGTAARFCNVIEILLEVVAVLILVMAAGGLSAKQLAGDMARAYEVMRRGEETSEVLIPVPGHPRRSKEDREETRERIAISDDDNDPLYDPRRFGVHAQQPPQAQAPASQSIPLEEPPKS